jgi:ribonuclease BN (tRNA processing enzyme)
MRIRPNREKQLPLTNDGVLTLFPVGCGSAFSKKLFQNNYLVIKGDSHVMIDCGTRAPKALHSLGHGVGDIRTWLITHSHADHIGGLEEVMLMGRYVTRTKPSVIITEEYQETLWNQSLRGGCEFSEIHDGKGMSFEDYWTPIRPVPVAGQPRDTRSVDVGPINIKMIRTVHFPEQAQTWQESAYSAGLIIDDRILFTGDTKFDPEFLRNYDEIYRFEYIFHDVQFFTGGIHASLDEISTLEPDLKRRIILTHYADAWPDHAKRVKKEGILGFAKQWSFYRFD